MIFNPQLLVQFKRSKTQYLITDLTLMLKNWKKSVNMFVHFSTLYMNGLILQKIGSIPQETSMTEVRRNNPP